MLREEYLLYLFENNEKVYNENYKTEKLQEKITKHFGNRIQFWRPSSRGELVYSTDIVTGQTVEAAFELAASDEKRVEEAVMVLRRHIIESHRASDNIQFPSATSWLLSEDRESPDLFQNFLSSLVSGKLRQNLSEKSKRFVSSCLQDICNAATNGQWLMPKHVLLAMTVHNLTGSAELITILNRFGHCQSYSRTLELETAMCKSVNEQLYIFTTKYINRK